MGKKIGIAIAACVVGAVPAMLLWHGEPALAFNWLLAAAGLLLAGIAAVWATLAVLQHIERSWGARARNATEWAGLAVALSLALVFDVQLRSLIGPAL